MQADMRICLLTSGHKPNDDRIFFKEARSLSKYYRDVWIISPFESHIPLQKDGVHFLPVSTHPKKLMDRFKTVRELFEAGLRLKADVYHCHEPESLVAAAKLKEALGCKIVFDSHEMYPATLAQRFPKVLHSTVRGLYRIFENMEVGKCDFVIGATPGISESLVNTVSPHRTETIWNCSLPDVLGPSGGRDWGEETIICHDGSLTFSRGLKSMVEAIEIASKKHRVKLRIVGDVFGPEKEWLEAYIRTNHLEKVIERTGWLAYQKIGQAISGCHIGLIAFDERPNHVIAAPNKLFNYMYFGLPVIAPDYCTGIKRIIEDEQCGLTVNNISGTAYADAICLMIGDRKKAADMGLNAKKAADSKYSWPIMEKRLINIYRRLE